MRNAERILLSMIEHRFKLNEKEAQALLAHAERRHYAERVELQKQLKADNHWYASELRFDSFASDWLIEGLNANDKYLAIEADKGLVWHWTNSNGQDDAKTIAQSLQHLQAWALRQKQGDRQVPRYETKTVYDFERFTPVTKKSAIDSSEFATWDEIYQERYGEPVLV